MNSIHPAPISQHPETPGSSREELIIQSPILQLSAENPYYVGKDHEDEVVEGLPFANLRRPSIHLPRPTNQGGSASSSRVNPRLTAIPEVLNKLPQLSGAPLQGKITDITHSCCSPDRMELELTVYGKTATITDCLSSRPIFSYSKYRPLTFNQEGSSTTTTTVYVSNATLKHFTKQNQISSSTLSTESPVKWMRHCYVMNFASRLNSELRVPYALAEKVATYILELKPQLQNIATSTSFSPVELPEVKFTKIKSSVVVIYFKRKAFVAKGESTKKLVHPHQIGAGSENVARMCYDMTTLQPYVRRVYKTYPTSSPYPRIKRTLDALHGREGIALPYILQTVPGKTRTRHRTHHKIIQYMRYFNSSDLFELKETFAQKKQDGLFNFQDLIDIASQLLTAGVSLYRANILHRDIKCENTFVNYLGAQEDSSKARWEVQIADLDTGTPSSDDAEKSRLYGTPHYHSPELSKLILLQKNGLTDFLAKKVPHNFSSVITSKSEVWSLALTLFEVCCSYGSDENFKWPEEWSFDALFYDEQLLEQELIQYMKNTYNLQGQSDDEIVEHPMFSLERINYSTVVYIKLRSRMSDHPLPKPAEDAPFLCKLLWKMLSPLPEDRPSITRVREEFLKHYTPRKLPQTLATS